MFEIVVNEVWSEELLPFERLQVVDNVFGDLQIAFDGLKVPELGPKEGKVRLNDWIKRFATMQRKNPAAWKYEFESSPTAPFLCSFQRSESLVFFSLLNRRRKPVEPFDRLKTEWVQFESELRKFKLKMKELLYAHCSPERAQDWWKNWAGVPLEGA